MVLRMLLLRRIISQSRTKREKWCATNSSPMDHFLLFVSRSTGLRHWRSPFPFLLWSLIIHVSFMLLEILAEIHICFKLPHTIICMVRALTLNGRTSGVSTGYHQR